MVDEPKPIFPRLKMPESDAVAGASRGGSFGKALFRTFVQPGIDQVHWRARQLAPKQMAYNILSASTFGQKMIDLQGNYEELRNPGGRGGFNDPKYSRAQDIDSDSRRRRSNDSPDPGAGPQGPGSARSDLASIVSTIQSGLSAVAEEVRNVRKAVVTLNSTSAKGTVEQAGTKSKVTDLVEVIKHQMKGDAAGDKVNKLGQEAANGNSQGGSESPKKDGIMGLLMGLVSTFMGGIKGTFMKALAPITGMIKGRFAALGAGIRKLFSGIKFPKLPKMPAIGRLGSGLAKAASGLMKAIGPIGKIISGVARIGGRFAVVTTVIMAAFDGIMGFFNGWTKTDGPIWKKLAGGIDGMIQGIVKGLLEIPKMILQALKWVATGILDLLGFKKLAAALKGFDLGEWWDKTIGGLVEKFNPATALANLGEHLVTTFLDICSFVVKKLTGFDIDFNNMFNKDKDKEEDATPEEEKDGGWFGWFRRDREANAAPESHAPSAEMNNGQAAAGNAQGNANRNMDAVAAQGLTPALVNAVIQVESGGNTNAVSNKGARGRMQVMDNTNRDPGYGVRPARDNSAAERERVGRDYLAAMYRKYNGDTRKALAAYNAGPGAVDNAIREHGANWLSHLPRETQNYVPAVLARAATNRTPANAAPPAQRPAVNTTTPRVDQNTQELRSSRPNPVQARGATPPGSRVVVNNVSNQNNTIAPSRPNASDPGNSPTGPRS